MEARSLTPWSDSIKLCHIVAKVSCQMSETQRGGIRAQYIHYDSKLLAKGHSILFNHFIDMRTTVNLSILCRKNLFLLENFNKNTFFLHEIDKLTVVLMSIK